MVCVVRGGVCCVRSPWCVLRIMCGLCDNAVRVVLRVVCCRLRVVWLLAVRCELCFLCCVMCVVWVVCSCVVCVVLLALCVVSCECCERCV